MWETLLFILLAVLASMVIADVVVVQDLRLVGMVWRNRSHLVRVAGDHPEQPPTIDLLQAGSNGFSQGSIGIVGIQRPHVGATKFLLLDVGRFRC